MTAIIESYGTVIVLEDDLVTNRYFLRFMNDALARYEKNPKVTGVTGFSHFADTVTLPCESYFHTLTGTSWSWATWADRWRHFDETCSDWTRMKEDAKLRRRFNYDNTYNFYKIMKDQQTDAGTNSWAIRWYWTNFKRDGYILSLIHIWHVHAFRNWYRDSVGSACRLWRAGFLLLQELEKDACHLAGSRSVCDFFRILPDVGVKEWAMYLSLIHI